MNSPQFGSQRLLFVSKNKETLGFEYVKYHDILYIGDKTHSINKKQAFRTTLPNILGVSYP